MGSVNFPTFFTKRVNRAIEQSSNRAIEQSSNRAIEQSSNVETIIVQNLLSQIQRLSFYHN